MFNCLFLKLIDCNWKYSYWIKLPKCRRNKDVPCNYMWLLHYYLPITHLPLFSVSCSSDLWSGNAGTKEMVPWVEPEEPSSNIQHPNNKTRGDCVYLPGFLQWDGSWKQRDSLEGHWPASAKQCEKQVPSLFFLRPPHTLWRGPAGRNSNV